MNERGIISIRDVSKHFGAVHAVNNVDLEIQRGEFFSLLGPSGCGKTTLLRMLAGFEVPSEGEIYIDDQPMSAIPAYRRPVNMVFQNYAIFPHLDVRDNIAFGLRKSGLSKSQINAKVEDMLNLIKLPGYAERSGSELSGGERQRIALARALIIAIDDPTMRRFQTVAHIGQRPPDDDAHGVVHIRAPHLILDVDARGVRSVWHRAKGPQEPGIRRKKKSGGRRKEDGCGNSPRNPQILSASVSLGANECYTSRFFTSSAWSSMNFRRGST